MASTVIASMQSIQRQTQDMPMTSWFDVPYAMLAAVYKSDAMFEVCVFAVLVLSPFVWRALKGEPAILKSHRQKGSKRVTKIAKCVVVADGEVDVPDEPSKSTTGEAVPEAVPKRTPWRAASLAKMQPSYAKVSKPRRAHPDQHGCPMSVSEEASQIMAMVAEQYTGALRRYRELVRTGKDAQIRNDDFYLAFLEAALRVGHADVVRSLLEAMCRNLVVPSVGFCQSVMRLLGARQMYAECVYMCELFGDKMPTDCVVKSCARRSFRELGNTRPAAARWFNKLQAAGELDPAAKPFVMPNQQGEAVASVAAPTDFTLRADAAEFAPRFFTEASSQFEEGAAVLAEYKRVGCSQHFSEDSCGGCQKLNMPDNAVFCSSCGLKRPAAVPMSAPTALSEDRIREAQTKVMKKGQGYDSPETELRMIRGCYLQPEHLLGAWADSLGNAVNVYSLDAYEVRLMATISRPPPRTDAHVPVRQMDDGGWQCGNSYLNTMVSSEQELHWAAPDGRISIWDRAHRSTEPPTAQP